MFSWFSYLPGCYGYPVLSYSLCNPLQSSSRHSHHLIKDYENLRFAYRKYLGYVSHEYQNNERLLPYSASVSCLGFQLSSSRLLLCPHEVPWFKLIEINPLCFKDYLITFLIVHRIDKHKIKFPWPLFQATNFNHSNVFISILLTSEGEAGKV